MNLPARSTDRAGLLLAVLLAGATTLPFLTRAPNRLLTGEGLGLVALHGPAPLALAPLLGVLLLAPWLPRGRAWQGLCLFAAAALGNALPWIAGAEARRLTQGDDALVRIGLGGGFWLLMLGALLSFSESTRKLGFDPARKTLLGLLALAPLCGILAAGQLDALSLLREYDNYSDTFGMAGLQHLRLVLLPLLPALLAGTGLGVAAYRSPRWRNGIFPVLNILQTIPSIALFGMLIGPLAWIGQHWPQSGIAGVGPWPACVALALYALLPLARGTCAGLQQVPEEAREAARGMGMTGWQVFRKVELPLALPVFIGGLRVTTVQAVGLSAVAALIGAGGFGAIVFQGLSASALDQVLLGVLPIVAMALAVDTAFKLGMYWLDRNPHDRTD